MYYKAGKNIFFSYEKFPDKKEVVAVILEDGCCDKPTPEFLLDSNADVVFKNKDMMGPVVVECMRCRQRALDVRWVAKHAKWTYLNAQAK